MRDTPPFDPPYKTFHQTGDGLQVIETLANGTTRIVPSHETSLPLHLLMPRVPQAATGKPVLQSPATRNDRTAMVLDVPFAQKDDAKRLGAKWDAAKRKWYVPHGIDVNLFKQWWPAV
jgi:hypothetical protein